MLIISVTRFPYNLIDKISIIRHSLCLYKDIDFLISFFAFTSQVITMATDIYQILATLFEQTALVACKMTVWTVSSKHLI